MLLLIAILALGAGAVFFSLYSPASRTANEGQTNAAVLAQARDALIGRAASAASRPGSLPCPDTDNDGLENWDVGMTVCASYVGRLPWRTLGLPGLRDGSGERLWYALSPNFRDHASVQPLNSDTAGQLTITGTGSVSNFVAIIFAPGSARGSQVRNAANENNAAHYLDGENNNGDLIFAAATASDTFNDRLLPLTSDTLFNTVAVRVAKDVRQALEQYRTTNGYYPFANKYSDGSPYVCTVNVRDGRIPLAMQPGCGSIAEWVGELPSWFAANNWNLVTHYGMDNLCALTVTGTTTAACTVVIVTGGVRSGQTHPCINPTNCLEDAENVNGDTVYVKPSRYPASNDRMAVSCAAATPCLTVP
jgi:type II secretory pathway pseudopilin PulG